MTKLKYVAMEEILDEEKGLSPEVVLSVGDKIRVSYKDGNRYDAKIIKWRKEDGASCQYLVHYKDWNARHDEWIERSRIAGKVTFGSYEFVIKL